MNHTKLNLNLLRTLSIILHERSLSQAGRILNLSQSAMSNTLSQARELFHDELLIRHANSMILTAKGETVLREMKPLFASFEKMMQHYEAFDPQKTERQFVIGFCDYGWMNQRLLPQLINHLNHHAPNMRLDTRNLASYSPQDLHQTYFEAGKYMDLVIGFVNSIPPNLIATPLFPARTSCVAHADHPYIKEPTLENYLASEHVIMAEPHYGALTQTDRYLMEKHKTKRRIAMHFADVYQILSVITHAKQPYLATLPEGILKDYPNKALRACPPPFQNKSQDIVMLWDPYHRKDKAHRWLRQAIQHWAGTQDHSPQD